jgi:hypothetical protein
LHIGWGKSMLFFNFMCIFLVVCLHPQVQKFLIGLSPAQIFFGRRLGTLLPTTAPLLNAHK